MDASSPDLQDAAVTPMMAQYLEIRKAAGDALLFYRMGDFFELFFDDAVKAAAALDIALTKRGRHRGEDIPMCGVPVHAHEAYLARLIKKGFRVAICEQTEDPAEAKKRGGKSVVRRQIVRLVTPGTLTEEALLDAGRNNFLGALALLRGGRDAALAWADVSTGELYVRQTSLADVRAHAAACSFSELIIPSDAASDAGWSAALKDLASETMLAFQPDALFDSRAGERRLLAHFGVASLEGYGEFARADLAALGALLSYISLTQVGRIPALRPPQRAEISASMLIDAATRASLELFEARSGGRGGALLGAVDRTMTGAGARLLAARLSAPLTDPAAIDARLDAVAALVEDAALRERLRRTLAATPDMARALTRLSLTRGGPRDLAAIRDGIEHAREIARDIAASGALGRPPQEIADSATALEAGGAGGFSDLLALLKEALAADPPLLARDGGFIAKGFDPALDGVRMLRDDSRRVVAGLEAKYRAETELKSLKVRHNNVLGYFIETPPSGADRLLSPPHDRTFIHRQTIASAARFSTVELGELDAKIARARDEALARELEIFERLAAAVLDRAVPIAAAADAAARLDVALGFAALACEENYARPIVDDSLAFAVDGGRHPVVEQALRKAGAGAFVANDCRLGDAEGAHLWLVTGPNMAGKSTFLRQNALIAILAQAGAFVPARAAHVGVADRVFSRVGAADDLARGRSTFMAEMVEAAAILNRAGPRSLVILDEIGRGTSTFDGMSIAWAAIEHLHDTNKCRALFATHFHELTELSGRLARLVNVSMRVREWKGDIVFLHELATGPADRSYGIAVARLAGLPQAVLARAEAVLELLERRRGERAPLSELPLFAAAQPKSPELSPDPAQTAFLAALAALDPDSLPPREAIEALYRLKSLAEAAAPFDRLRTPARP